MTASTYVHKHTHSLANAVLLVWSLLGFAPIINTEVISLKVKVTRLLASPEQCRWCDWCVTMLNTRGM